ncbi:MAG: DeoR/GlpR transcriptional regulator [Clostridia bacterium]|nr:DeoR/GlpR transcriptional regulator [Clostridia bacterium]
MRKSGDEMSITNRQEQILELLRENSFMTVEKLSELTYTSASSVRRDLTQLENMYLIKRTHGGASVLNEINGAAPLDSRMKENVSAKRKIAKKASVLLKDGASIMLDGSTTAGFLIPYIAKLDNITLFTNNMITAINAINYGIETHCIGGKSVNNSAVLSGERSYKEISGIYPDILFFSSHGLTQKGEITDPTSEENYLRSLMIKNAEKTVFLCDSEKFGRKSLYTLCNVNDVDVCVFDDVWDKLEAKCEIL